MFEFVRGALEKPSGNLLVFAYSRGRNVLFSGNEVIVCNVVVSFLSAESGHFPVVAFPPKSLEKEEELALLLHLNPDYDVFRLEDFEIPIDENPKSYIRMRIRRFNIVVAEYVEMCRNYIEDRTKQGEKDFLYPLAWQQNLPHSSSEAPIVAEESFCIEQLEKSLQMHQAAPDKAQPCFHKIISIMEAKYPNYDVNNFARAVGLDCKKQWSAKASGSSSDVKLAKLYLRKFRAIHEEKYEEAAKIQDHIHNIEWKTKTNMN